MQAYAVATGTVAYRRGPAASATAASARPAASGSGTVAVEAPQEASEHKTGKRLAWAIGCSFVLMLFFNDVGNLVNIKVGVNLRPDRLFLPMLLIVYVARRRYDRTKVRIHPAEWSMLFLLAWSVVSLVVSGSIYHPENRHASNLVSWLGLPFATLWCVRRSNLSRRDIALVMRVLIVLGIYLAATAIFEHYRLWALVFPRYIADPHVGIHFGRVRGPFGNAGALGAVLSILYVITLFYANNVRAVPVLRLLLVFIAVSVYFTYTRSAWLTLLVSFFVLGLLKSRMRRHCAAVIALACVVFLSGAFSKLSFEEGTLFTQRQETVEDRANIMRATIAMISERPFLGFGYGTFQSRNLRYFDSKGVISAGEGNHNAFSGALVELGLVGLLPYLLTWAFLARSAWHLARRYDPASPYWGELGTVTLSVLAGYIVGVQFFDPRWFGFMNCLVFFVSGLACAADQRYAMAAAKMRAR